MLRMPTLKTFTATTSVSPMFILAHKPPGRAEYERLMDAQIGTVQAVLRLQPAPEHDPLRQLRDAHGAVERDAGCAARRAEKAWPQGTCRPDRR